MSTKYNRRLRLEILESQTVLSIAGPLLPWDGATGGAPANLETPQVIIPSGIPDVTVNEDAPDTFIRLHDWFDNQPGGPDALTFTIQAISPPGAAIFSSTAIKTGMADTRTAHTATRLTNGSVLVTGGFFFDG